MNKRIAHNRLSISIINQRLSKLGFTLISIYTGVDNKHKIRCFCGNIFETVLTSIFQGLTKSCGCKNHRTKEHNLNWKGYGELSGAMFSLIKRNAKRKNRKFEIKIEQIWNLFIEQNRRCALSGIELVFSKNNRLRESETTASLDRINPEIGYIITNVRWVHKDINYLRHGYKTDFTDDRLLFLCKNIVNTIGGSK